MAATIGKLSVVLTASTGAFRKGMARASKTMSSFGARMKRIGKVAAIAMAAGMVVGVLAVRRAMRAIVRSIGTAVNDIDNLAKTSRKLGVSTQALAALRISADRAGVATTALDKSFQMMLKSVGEASQGLGEAKDAFEFMRIDVASLKKLAPEKQFEVILGKLQKIRNVADRIAFASDIFGARGAGVLNITAKDFEAGRKRAERFNLDITAEQAAGVEKFKDAMSDLKDSFKGVAQVLTVQLAPVLTMITNAITSIGVLASNTLESFLKRLDTLNAAIIFFGKLKALSGGDIQAGLPSARSGGAFVGGTTDNVANGLLRQILNTQKQILGTLGATAAPLEQIKADLSVRSLMGSFG